MRDCGLVKLLLLNQPAPPAITSFAPSSGPVGSEIRIYGSGFAGLTGATVGGVALTGFAIISDGEVRGTIAAGTTTGRVVAGAATSATDFVVTAAGGYTDEQAQDAVGAALVAGQHSGVAFTYGPAQDGANRIDGRLLLPSTGLFYWTGAVLQPIRIGAGLAIVGDELVATGGYTPQAQAYFARLTGTYSNTWKDAVNARITELIAAGIWTLLDGLWVPKIAANVADARLNLISASYPLTGGAFVTGGLRTNGSAVNTGYNPGAGTLKYTRNNAHVGVYLHQNLTANTVPEQQARVAGMFASGSVSLLYADVASDGYATINTTGLGTYNIHPDLASGFMQANRLSSGSFASNFAGTRLTGNHVSQAVASAEFLIAPAGWDGIFSAVTIGAGLDNTQDEILRTTIEAMLA